MRADVLTRLLLSGALAALTGCTAIPRSGPSEIAISQKAADLAGFTLIEVNADNVGEYRVTSDGDGAGTGGVPAAPRIRLAAGDILKVNIAESKEGGLFAPLSGGGTGFSNVRVDHKGTISLPYAGRVPVAGLDPQQVEDRIRSRLAGVAFEPQVYVELMVNRGSSVLVGGLAKTPGRFSMLDGPMTLIDAINRAGGPAIASHQVDVVIRRGNKVTRIAMAEIEDGKNVQLSAGDEVILEANVKVFNALGALAKTGQIEFNKPHMSLLDAIAVSGGLADTQASTTGVFVFRLREPKAWLDADNHWQEGPVIFRFNMSKPETMFIAQAFGVSNNDTVYVTNAPSVEWDRTIAPIANTLRAVNSGVSVYKNIHNLVAK